MRGEAKVNFLRRFVVTIIIIIMVVMTKSVNTLECRNCAHHFTTSILGNPQSSSRAALLLSQNFSGENETVVRFSNLSKVIQPEVAGPAPEHLLPECRASQSPSATMPPWGLGRHGEEGSSLSHYRGAGV